MSHDYPGQEYLPYAHMLDLPPHHHLQDDRLHHYPPPHYPVHHQLHTIGSSGAGATYEMSEMMSAEAGLPPPAPPLQPCDAPQSSLSQYGEYEMGSQQCSGSSGSSAGAGTGSARKRKSSSFGTGSTLEDDSPGSNPNKKQNHSEIEKRRRDKMNTYISELSCMIPLCGATTRKLDKLSVLRLAVVHLRSVRGALTAAERARGPRSALLPPRDLNALLLSAAAAPKAFLVVVGCDRGRLLYVSHNVQDTLLFHQNELVGQSLFDILHPKDVSKVKEQFSSSDLSPRKRLIDAKTKLPVGEEATSGAERQTPGARRSFFCRIKTKYPPHQFDDKPSPLLEDADKLRKKFDKKYCVVQCTGYLKSWAPMDLKKGCCEEEEQASVSCLVALCRELPALRGAGGPPAARLQYVSRHAHDGKFLFVDQRVRLALGFLPQELLGTSLYEYVPAPELAALARAHKHVLLRDQPLATAPYPFRRKDGSRALIQTHFKPFRNPWTKEIECLVANNTLMPDSARYEAPHPYEAFQQTEEWRAYLRDGGPALSGGAEEAGPWGGPTTAEPDAEVARLVASQVESHRIGACIAEEARRRQPPSAPPSPALHHLLSLPAFNASLDNILGVETSAFPVRNNVPLSCGAAVPSPEGTAAPPGSPLVPADGNSEAAMAVIMSLLEADAGLGGPISISGLPWSLP